MLILFLSNFNSLLYRLNGNNILMLTSIPLIMTDLFDQRRNTTVFVGNGRNNIIKRTTDHHHTDTSNNRSSYKKQRLVNHETLPNNDRCISTSQRYRMQLVVKQVMSSIRNAISIVFFVLMVFLFGRMFVLLNESKVVSYSCMV